MRYYQELFNQEFKNIFSFPDFATRLIKNKLREKGIELTKSQSASLKELLQTEFERGFNENHLGLIIEDDGKIKISPGGEELEIKIELGIDADDEINKILENLPELITGLSNEISEERLQELHSRSGKLLNDIEQQHCRFDNILREKWGRALRLLEMYISLTEECIADYIHSIQTSNEIKLSYRFEILVLLNARACQVAKEILTLLCNGFADGAHARWRTLHELSVDTNIIFHNNNELALKYQNHQIIQKYKSARIYKEHSEQLGFEPIDDQELAELKKMYDLLVEQYGIAYKNNYGWASEITRKSNPNFTDLEALVDLSHMRPFYKLANINIHSGAYGMSFRLGLSQEQQDEILLTGPSIIGLGDPIQNTAYSLLLITSNLLTYEPDLDGLIDLNVLMKMEQELFSSVDETLNLDLG